MPPPPVLKAAPTPAVERPITMAAPKLEVLELDERRASFYNEQVAAAFVIEGFRVTTAKEINALIGLERQKQLLGCSEDAASCLAELANALGVETVLNGEVARVGQRYQLLLKVLEAGSARVLALYTTKVDSEEALMDEFPRAARTLATEVSTRMNRKLVRRAVVARSGPAETMRAWWWLPVVSGVALAAGGGYGLYVADGHFRSLNRPTQPLPLQEAQDLRSSGRLAETLGVVGVATGAAAVGAGITMWVLGQGGADPQASVLPTAGGGLYVQFQGVFQ